MSKVAFDFGIIQVYWYSICILVGMIVGMFFVLKEAKRKNYNLDVMTDIIFYTVIWGVIGARLYYVLFNLNEYSQNFLEVFEIWNGGLAIHGGILFGSLYMLYAVNKRKINLFKTIDICAPGLIIGQAIGRWGNFFNGEVFGKVVNETFFKAYPKFIKDGMYIDGQYRTPLFLYESVWNLVGFIILLIFRRRKYIKEGQVTGVYLIWYSIGRLIIEGMRDPQFSLMLGNFRVAQIVSIMLMGVGVYLIIRKMKTTRFEYLYNSEEISQTTSVNTINSINQVNTH